MSSQHTLAEAIRLVEAHKGQLTIDKSKHAEYIAFLRTIEKRENEDFRQAVLIAVDGAKTLFAVGTGAFVAVGAFIQFGFSRGLQISDLPIWLLGAAAAFLFWSMIEGLVVIGQAYKRGEGVETDDKQDYRPWSVLPLRPHLRNQSAVAGLGCLALAGAVVVWIAGAYGSEPEDSATRDRPAQVSYYDGLQVAVADELVENLISDSATIQTAQRRLDELDQSIERLSAFTSRQWHVFRTCLLRKQGLRLQED